jgi:hypothetical protein
VKNADELVSTCCVVVSIWEGRVTPEAVEAVLVYALEGDEACSAEEVEGEEAEAGIVS